MIRLLDILSFFLEWGYVLVLLKMIHTFLPLRKNMPARLAAFLVSGFLFPVIIYSNDFAGLFGAFGGICAYIAVFHCGQWPQKVSAVLVFYPAIIAVNYLMQDIGAGCFFAVSGAPPSQTLGWTRKQLLLSAAFHTLSLLLRLLLWTGAWLILRKYLQRAVSNLTVKMWFLINIFMLAPCVAVFTIIYFMPENPLIVYPICIASIFSSFCCLYLVCYISDSIRTAYRAKELEMRQAYYREQQEAEERVRCVYHDMKNHLLVLERQLQSPEATEMLEKLRQETSIYEDYVHTGNDIVDIILRDKARLARENHIDFSVAADLHEIDFMEPLDVSTIFGNALDNALEASGQLPSGQRAVLVKAGKIRDFFSVLIENSCTGDSKPSRGRTTKQDDFLHGFGIVNMQRAVEKYGGQLNTDCENGKFTLKILIPIPQSSALS